MSHKRHLLDVKSYYGHLSQMIACLGCAVGTGKASVAMHLVSKEELVPVLVSIGDKKV